MAPEEHRVPYEQLRAGAVAGVDPKIKEQYLDDAQKHTENP